MFSDENFSIKKCAMDIFCAWFGMIKDSLYGKHLYQGESWSSIEFFQSYFVSSGSCHCTFCKRFCSHDDFFPWESQYSTLSKAKNIISIPTLILRELLTLIQITKVLLPFSLFIEEKQNLPPQNMSFEILIILSLLF